MDARGSGTTPAEPAGEGTRVDGVPGDADVEDDHGADATVLVVDDDVALAELYAAWLSETYEVLTATDGEAALALAAEHDVDVLLLDRRMPGTSGDEVLDAVRERGDDCRTAMVTGVDPDFDVVDIPFDDYLVKPVTAEDLRGVVRTLLALDEYADIQIELSSKRVRQSVLAREKNRYELAGSDEYARLLADIDDLERRADDIERRYPERHATLERIARSPGVAFG